MIFVVYCSNVQYNFKHFGAPIFLSRDSSLGSSEHLRSSPPPPSPIVAALALLSTTIANKNRRRTDPLKHVNSSGPCANTRLNVLNGIRTRARALHTMAELKIFMSEEMVKITPYYRPRFKYRSLIFIYLFFLIISIRSKSGF